MRFQDRVALITGAGSGIGRATARRLAAEGARLALVDWSGDGLEDTVAAIRQDSAGTAGADDTLWTGIIDVSDEAAVERCVSDVIKAFGRIDVLCNNAGISGGHLPVTEQSTSEWQRVLGVNLAGPMLMIKNVAPHMQAQGGGAIVNTASVAGIRSGAGGNAYSASKAGLINLTMTTACDLGSYSIRVNAVCPGLIETGMTRPVFEYARSNDKEHKLGSRCELRRYGRPEEIAAAIAFLASDDASYITGQALPVDGGNTASLNMPGMKV
ncbi:SDR family NAD(P)-dependent oxidoreductase [Hydrocarboniclastica marina]|uniref:SDR family NAD(P)-dependent oxidoreductase n=1 Tax=Hydrocarboniclastica marina TaxID=2259620 RepID=A0A4P7XDC1_9ALTE|nr:SDR family NAD(P)-dependent oxidoreductase [Hydrocarboniclastica marina]MAL99041.1 oxidoreductase [Alteromonadaceae bacterium]QCF24879.1 SDR family NAD(P)-dependent oxidoreductase [Hydrocarboniclastica marina]